MIRFTITTTTTNSSTTTTSATPSTTSAWRPWANLGESTPYGAYQTYFQTAVNSLHPSCTAPASPMEVEDDLELEEIPLVRGAHDHLLEREEEQQVRRDRDRRGQNRGERHEIGHRRDRGQDRGDGRSHRDRNYRPRRDNPRRN